MYVGYETDKSVVTVDDALQGCLLQGADFVIIDIAKPSGDSLDFIEIEGLSSDELNNSVVGRIRDYTVSADTASLIQSQIGWANHAGFYSILIEISILPFNTLRSLIADFMVTYPPDLSITRIWIQCKPNEWGMWNALRLGTNHASKLAVCLDLSDGFSNFHETWFGEPVASIILPNSSIDTSVILRFFRLNTQPIVRDSQQINSIISIFQSLPALLTHERYIAPYHDSLQLPLQPLRDEMQNVVYETFETDKIKYDLYMRAVKDAISKIEGPCHIAVVGAGRGGLVNAAIKAISASFPNDMKRFSITCVEKNQFAVITLMHKLRRLWTKADGPSISVQHSDMRGWVPSVKVDVLVSELLGSLGDNEASPECLNDSVMSHLDPVRGVSIPHRYYSTIEPVSAHKLWIQVREMKKFETPLVALFNTYYQPSNEGPQKMFEFVHDRGSSQPKLERSATMTWTSKSDTLIHGFAGYFHSDLDSEGNVVMSIDPRTATPGMVSWFPAFLPLTVPVLVHQGEKIQLHVQRKSTVTRMWIEWTLLEPLVQPTHNLNGEHHSVGLV